MFVRFSSTADCFSFRKKSEETDLVWSLPFIFDSMSHIRVVSCSILPFTVTNVNKLTTWDIYSV